MNSLSLAVPWNISIEELNNYLRAAGVEAIALDDAQLVRDLDAPTRARRIESLRKSAARARADAPPVAQWLAASEAVVMQDDGSSEARARADTFWLRLSQIVYGCLALVMLGDLSEFPFFVELLRHQPAGHLAELATDVLRHYVDPRGELDRARLVHQAEVWWREKPCEG